MSVSGDSACPNTGKLEREAGSDRCVRALNEAESLQMSAASVLEVAMVVESRYGGIAVMVVTRDQVKMAREGFRRFGKGRHLAALNFGDCFSYGLTMALAESLLFCAQDFSRTDVRVA